MLRSHFCIFPIYRAANRGVKEPSGHGERGIILLWVCPFERNEESAQRERKKKPSEVLFLGQIMTILYHKGEDWRGSNSSWLYFLAGREDEDEDENLLLTSSFNEGNGKFSVGNQESRMDHIQRFIICRDDLEISDQL